MSTISCLVSVKHKGVARKYTLTNPTVSGLKEAVSRCPLLSVVVDLDKDNLQVGGILTALDEK